MKVLDIIKLVCEFVGEKELFSKLIVDEALNEKETEKVATMQRCFNLVNQEIASDFIPFLQKEQVCGSFINFETLSKKMISIFQVKNRFGINLKFKIFPNYVEVYGCAKTIIYSYFPDELSLQDDVQMFCGLCARVYAYGVASEYLLICGNDDAEIWENRFKDSLFVLSRKKGEHILPKRRWF